MTPRTRTVARVASAAAVLAATLPPAGAADPARVDPLCLACGATGVAELLLNAALFLPLGLAVARLATGARGVGAALAWGLVLSIGVEAGQLVIPGRHPALGDLLANVAGAGIGGSLAVTSSRWLHAGDRAASALSSAWGALAASIFLGTALLLQPALPASDYWIQHAPDLGQFARFRGTVLSARSGGVDLPAGRLAASDRRSLGSVLARGPHLAARVRLGDPPAGLAPVLSVFDGRQREILVLGQDGRDLVFRLRRRAADLGLRRPEIRASGLLAGLSAGETVVLAVRPDPRRAAGGLCLRAGPSRRCGLGHRAGSGWSLLVGPVAAPGTARALDAAWIALLLLPLGFWARPRAGWRTGLLAALGALAAAPLAGPVLAAGVPEAAGAALGLLGGLGLERLVGSRRSGRSGSSEP